MANDAADHLALATHAIEQGDRAAALQHAHAAVAALELHLASPTPGFGEDVECDACVRGELVGDTVVICRGAGPFTSPCPSFKARWDS